MEAFYLETSKIPEEPLDPCLSAALAGKFHFSLWSPCQKMSVRERIIKQTSFQVPCSQSVSPSQSGQFFVSKREKVYENIIVLAYWQPNEVFPNQNIPRSQSAFLSLFFLLIKSLMFPDINTKKSPSPILYHNYAA